MMLKRIAGMLCFGVLLLSNVMAVKAAEGAYYVDSESGNDSNIGSSEGSAWKSLEKVNGTTFDPGSRILFKAGGEWTGQLSPKGSGTEGNPIIIDKYGIGKKPLIAANGAISGVYLRNQPYWEIHNLEITNKTNDWGDYHGISIIGREFGTINHIYIKNCYIHDVHGVVAWIGDTKKNMTGVINSAGWDKSKHSGGIVFDVESPSSKKTNFNDILIENNIINDCSFGGICIKQRQGSVGWGGRSSATDGSWYPHTNCVIRGNYLSQYNTDHGCNTMYITNVKGGLIEKNVCAKSGVSAIELYFTDDVIVQRNETYGTVHRCNSADHNGIDADKGTSRTVFQYNYVHDNGDGILFCQFSFGDMIVRYNILQNNSRHGFNLHSDARATAQVYNNVLYTKISSSTLVASSGGSKYFDRGRYVFKNNIFYSAAGGPPVTDGPTSTYDNNCYYGTGAVGEDSHKKTSNPQFVDPGKGGSGDTAGWALSTLDGYMLKESSPCVNAGVSIADNGGMDFWGGVLKDKPDIGAREVGTDVVSLARESDRRNSTLAHRIPTVVGGIYGTVFSLDGKRIGSIKRGEKRAVSTAGNVQVLIYGNEHRKAKTRVLPF